jgi:2-polyprenyl-3-methyl-5-hydroxy-6-metoxy-1,4-benzoquinol methylase
VTASPSATPPTKDIHASEAHFHDEWAESTRVEDVEVRAAFEAPTAPENRCILAQMAKLGGLKGKRVLDVGAGLGESSVYFALQGADVTTTDISPGMVAFAERLAAHHGTSVRGAVSEGESLNVDPASFDYVYIANTVHHVVDREAMWQQVRRALKPGGWFFAWDPLAYNPVINLYRRMATQVRTEDESPLTFAELDRVRTQFQNVGHREFWIAGLALFAKYYLIDRVHPNADRYWKRILKETPSSLWWWRPLAAADTVLGRIPLVRRLAWNIVYWGQR